MPDYQTLNITTQIPVSPDRLFAAILSPEDVNVWMWCGMGKNPQAAIDAREGGHFRISIDVDDAMGWHQPQWAMTGFYITINAPKTLAYSLHWDAPVVYNMDGPVPDEVVTITIEPDGAGSTLHYRHIGIPSEDASKVHEHGIRASFDMLHDHLTKS